jgi:hypothetical protein
MEKELKFDGVLYMKMLDGETKEDADVRLCKILEDLGLCVLDGYEIEVNNI